MPSLADVMIDVPALNRRHLVVAAVWLAIIGGCDTKGNKPMSNSVDWQSLEFKCVHEDASVARPDAEAEEWYQQANTLFKAGIRSDSFETLSRSFELTKKAAERGHIKAMNNMVLAYQNGDGVKQSDSLAVQWAEELIKRDAGRGYYHMGHFLQQGIGVKQDRVAALSYFRKAADLGNAQGQAVVGEKIAESVAQSPIPGRERGFSIARSMYQCALDQGLAEAGYLLGQHYRGFEERYPEAMEAYQAGARLGHNQSLFVLWKAFEEGGLGQQKDEARAKCYKRLSEESDADKTRQFPDIDRICPLPPKSLPRS